MKVRNYEKQGLIIFILIVLIIIEILSFIVLYKYKVYKYKKLMGVISNKNIVTLVVDKNDKKLLYKNKKVYIDDKLLEYKIIENKGYIINKNNIKYYEVLIETKTPKNKKISDYIELSVKNKKINILELFKQIGEGG